MDVRSKIATFEKQNETARSVSSPGSPASPGIRRLPISPSVDLPSSSRLITAASSASIDAPFDPSPERPLSTTSYASQNRISRLQQRKNDAGPARTPSNLRCPQPPDSPAGGSQTKLSRQLDHERRVMGINGSTNGNGSPVPGPSSSLISHRKGKAGAAQQTVQAANSPTAQSVGNPLLSNGAATTRGGSTTTLRQPSPAHQRALVQPRARESSASLSSKVQARQKNKASKHTPETGMLPEIDHPSEEDKSPVRKSSSGRMAKVQRIKKIRNLEHVRRHSRKQNQEPFVPHSPPAFGAPTTVSSLDHDTDDEKTLTSVRQIVGNTYEESPKGNNNGRYADKGGLSPAFGDQASRMMWTDSAGEEKSDKAAAAAAAANANHGDHRRSLMMARSSSTEYDTDEDTSRVGSVTLYGEVVMEEPGSSVISSSRVTQAEAALLGQNRRTKTKRKSKQGGDNNGTFDRDDADDNSAESLSYEQRRQKEAREKKARVAAVAAARAQMDNGPFVQTEDVEHYRKSLDTPIAKTAAGIVGAATLGCIILGPVGLLIGAAAVGIGVGAMQIPQEQRSHMQDKASETMKNVQESAFNASETMSNSCVASYKDSGIAEHVPIEIESCCVGQEETTMPDIKLVDDQNGNEGSLNGDGPKEGKRQQSPVRSGRVRNKKEKVACLQEGKIIPLSQIHALNPSEQPRAWVDVLASAKTSNEEKAEALEEVLILAKDKQRARILLEEGILDSLMWMIGRYREKMNHDPSFDNWAHPEITPEDTNATRLAASCCMTLGKSHCAAIHTEGDLLLMSLYERGTVPEERQLAQMLHEVPFHTRVTATDDPTIIDPGQEVFAVKQMSLPQAEDLARSITALSVGRLM